LLLAIEDDLNSGEAESDVSAFFCDGNLVFNGGLCFKYRQVNVFAIARSVWLKISIRFSSVYCPTRVVDDK
jgi:hypothetical protein